MTLASAIADLEQARAERQDEMDAIDAALRELRTIRSNREGLSPSSPAHLPGTKDATPVFPQASSLPVRVLREAVRSAADEIREATDIAVLNGTPPVGVGPATP